jgi:hypothetical protein
VISPLVSAAESLRAILAMFDPALVSADDCAVAVAELARTEKACAAARMLAAARAAACGAHRDAGYRDPLDWLARATGGTRAEARTALDTAAQIDGCAEAKEAVIAGDLSIAQASEIAKTEAEVPGSGAEMLDLARRGSLNTLRDEGRKRRLAVVDPDELHDKQRAAQHVKHWRDDLGMVCGSFALRPEVGVAFINRLDAETDRLWKAARRAGSTVPRELHAADALISLMLSGDADGPGRKVASEVVLVADIDAFLRGHNHDGERCHIIGGGPVPLSVARDLARDAFLKVAFARGVQIDTIAHIGRRRSAELQTALDLGPDLDGVTCSEPACGRRYGLQWDHLDPVANGGPTSRANLDPKCAPHHFEKTGRDRAAGLLGNRAPP